MEVRLCSYKLFLEAPVTRITYEEMAKCYRISAVQAQEYLRRDLEAGLIVEEYPEYGLTDLGYEALYRYIRCGAHGLSPYP